MNFDFLKTVTLNKVEEPVKNIHITGSKTIERNPTNGASLRLFKDGSIYPSQELVDEMNLEYTKDKSGNGFDIFMSKDWSQYPDNQPNILFISTVSKSESRVDLFGSAREVNGELSSVLTQGSKTFGIHLVEMLQTTYGNELFNNSKSIDLLINKEVSIEQDIVYVPKTVKKGENVGMMTTERRENVTLYPLSLFSNNESSEIINEENVEEELELV